MTRDSAFLQRRAAITGIVLLGAALAWMLVLPAAERAPAAHRVIAGDGINGPSGMVWVPGGDFTMGSDHPLAQENERPAHHARVRGFWMDRTHVTNAQFRDFVNATGYITSAEHVPDWEALRVQLPPGTQRPPAATLVAGAMVFVGDPRPARPGDAVRWWRFVPGANWRHPAGPGSSIDGKDDHPVVQVSHSDALAFAVWAGKRLPTEAQWEFAARGGLEQATYVWGDAPVLEGQAMAAIWRSHAPFPVIDPIRGDKAGDVIGTVPVGSFPPNGYGLVDMTGNAWQWVADWYRADAFRRVRSGVAVEPAGPARSFDPDDLFAPADAPRRVIRGGSFLCSEEYCLSYRPSARQGSDPFNAMSHIGFRLVVDHAPPRRHAGP
jgi:sulfatase modifying factor 1